MFVNALYQLTHVGQLGRDFSLATGPHASTAQRPWSRVQPLPVLRHRRGERHPCALPALQISAPCHWRPGPLSDMVRWGCPACSEVVDESAGAEGAQRGVGVGCGGVEHLGDQTVQGQVGLGRHRLAPVQVRFIGRAEALPPCRGTLVL